MMRVLSTGLMLALCASAVGCRAVYQAPSPVSSEDRLGSVTYIRARCAAVDSCLVGHVVASDTARGMPEAAVFLVREAGESEDGKPVRILTLTDSQGVFTVEDAPAGRYRLAVYKDSRKVEKRGIKLGAPGTTVMPIRMPARRG